MLTSPATGFKSDTVAARLPSQADDRAAHMAHFAAALYRCNAGDPVRLGALQSAEDVICMLSRTWP